MAAKAAAEKAGKPINLDHDESHHEIVEHPNAEDVSKEPLSSTPKGENKDSKSKKNSCATIMRRLDQLVIKPLLIYKYEHGTHKK